MLYKASWTYNPYYKKFTEPRSIGSGGGGKSKI